MLLNNTYNYKIIFFFSVIISGNIFVYPFEKKKTNEKIFITSIPKCGSNMLAKLMELSIDRFLVKINGYKIEQEIIQSILPNQPQKNMFISHSYCTDNLSSYLLRNDYKVLFILRDPRDQVVSNVFHACKLFPSSFYLNNFDSILSGFIKDVAWRYNFFLDWKTFPNVYVTYFEKLVGSKGGGLDEEQYSEIMRILGHCGIDLSTVEIQTLQEQLFGGTWSFRGGQIGSWKKHFTLEHKLLFKKYAGHLLITLGYEKNNDW